MPEDPNFSPLNRSVLHSLFLIKRSSFLMTWTYGPFPDSLFLQVLILPCSAGLRRHRLACRVGGERAPACQACALLGGVPNNCLVVAPTELLTANRRPPGPGSRRRCHGPGSTVVRGGSLRSGGTARAHAVGPGGTARRPQRRKDRPSQS